MWSIPEEDVERLLRREGRDRLSLARLLRIYLDPGALFKDASRGNANARARALSYNRHMRWMLVPYIQRWTMIGASLFLGIGPAEAVSLLAAAAFAVGCSIALAITGCTATAYILLGSAD